MFGGFLLFLFAAPSLHAMGSLPLITDDPETPGNGRWEINLGISTERRPGLRASGLPLLDANYGIGDRLQFKYEVPCLGARADGRPSVSGLGNSEFGVKWRFYDAGEKKLAISVYPQFEFNNPGSNSAARGLVEPGSVFKLPCQFAKEAGPVTLIGQIGREFRSSGDRWFYGIARGHHVGEQAEVAIELAGGGTAKLGRTRLTTNLGAVVELNQSTSRCSRLGGSCIIRKRRAPLWSVILACSGGSDAFSKACRLRGVPVRPWGRRGTMPATPRAAGYAPAG